MSGRTNPALLGARAGEKDHSAHRECARAGAGKCVAWVVWVDWHADTFELDVNTSVRPGSACEQTRFIDCLEVASCRSWTRSWLYWSPRSSHSPTPVPCKLGSICYRAGSLADRSDALGAGRDLSRGADPLSRAQPGEQSQLASALRNHKAEPTFMKGRPQGQAAGLHVRHKLPLGSPCAPGTSSCAGSGQHPPFAPDFRCRR